MRNAPKIELSVGSDWKSFGLQLQKITDSHLQQISNNESKNPHNSTKLNVADIDVFGYSPMDDPLVLVTCMKCSKSILASRIKKHFEHCQKIGQKKSLESNTKASSAEIKVVQPAHPKALKRKHEPDNDSTDAKRLNTGTKPRPTKRKKNPVAEKSQTSKRSKKDLEQNTSSASPLATRIYVRRNKLRNVIFSLIPTHKKEIKNPSPATSSGSFSFPSPSPPLNISNPSLATINLNSQPNPRAQFEALKAAHMNQQQNKLMSYGQALSPNVNLTTTLLNGMLNGKPKININTLGQFGTGTILPKGVSLAVQNKFNVHGNGASGTNKIPAAPIK
eukprot:TRINITY_DN5770_c0_g1_i1.p1 TRINITY_DN5770_c0_g1~~TRINITY_DN5770_c0_g1_i1.p1  ORF type:complete len:333 (+),score=51.88 TRINITY_DN5770_c0_g1_i1:170-1168(+)